MNNNLNTNYLFKALDAYPFNLAETLEALNYALAYDDSDVEALYLMGVVYAEQLGDYSSAIVYFEEAIAKQIDFAKVYPYYALVLLNNEDYEKAEKVINFAVTLKGSDKASLKCIEATLSERQNKFKVALKMLKEAKKMGLNNDFITYVEGEISRVEKKLKLNKSKKKGKKKKKKKKGKTKKNA
jgi:tetratricopeptide (TPR) repeat protein